MGEDPFPLSVSIIDEEHREIERAAVELMNAIVLGAAQDSLIITGDELVRVTTLHFEHEEAMLKRIQFADLTREIAAEGDETPAKSVGDGAG